MREMWLITEEDSEGSWFSGPSGFNSEADALQFAKELEPPTKDHSYVLYRCTYVRDLTNGIQTTVK